MKIIKYSHFINEEFQDPPEEYIKTALTKLKKKLESFFIDDEGKDIEPDVGPESVEGETGSDNSVITMSQAIERGKQRKKSGDKMSFKDLNVHLESSEMSKYSAIYDSITLKFSDENNFYSLYITIPLEEGMSKKDDFSANDIKNCFVKFKKYDSGDFELIGQVRKDVKIDDIDEEFLVDLKIEIDDEFSEGEEEFEIET